MTLWRWSALAAVGVIACIFAFGAIPGLHACNIAKDPILAFEFVTSPAEVAALFPESCRAAHEPAQRTGLWLDGLVFIPVYSAFLILGLMALRREGGEQVARWAIGAVVVAALADQFEGLQLMRILNALPGEQSTIDLLMPAVRGKFALLAIAAGVAGWLHVKRGGWRLAAGTVAILGAIWSLSGLSGNHPWVTQGSGLAWLALIAAAFILSFRKLA